MADRHMFILAEWGVRQVGDEFFVVERGPLLTAQPELAQAPVIYGPMREDQTSPLIAERRAYYDELSKRLTKRQY
jgi:hypothetical protein